MGEYQQYEFQSIDRRLTSEDKAYLRSLSSRVKLGATSARFVYNFSDYRTKPEAVLDHCFDLMLYVASFGVRKLMIRFPNKLIDPAVFSPYCTSRCINIEITEKSVILNINLCTEDYYTWIEDDAEWLTDLVGLRSEILQGDFRVLYLTWLKSGFVEDSDDNLQDIIEPPVPPGLNNLSPALQSFVDFFMIDSDLIAAAAEVSPTATQINEPIADWIAMLSDSERNDYLLRVVQGDSLVAVDLMQHLHNQFGNKDSLPVSDSRRSLADLVAIAEQKEQKRLRSEKLEAELSRRQYLEKIAPQQNALWEQVMGLIALKQSQPYNQAITILQDLRDLAEYQGTLPAFQEKIHHLQTQYRNRPALMQRLRIVNLLLN